MNYQNFEYFVESLLENRKYDQYKCNKIDFKNSVIKTNYLQLVSDPQLHEFFLKRKRIFFSSKLTKDHLSHKIKKKKFLSKLFIIELFQIFFKVDRITLLFLPFTI